MMMIFYFSVSTEILFFDLCLLIENPLFFFLSECFRSAPENSDIFRQFTKMHHSLFLYGFSSLITDQKFVNKLMTQFNSLCVKKISNTQTFKSFFVLLSMKLNQSPITIFHLRMYSYILYSIAYNFG
jgi:hypothetical protein